MAVYFKGEEFACPCCGEVDINPELLEVLDKARGYFGVPVRVTSGYRCEDYNARVGGVKRSQHKLGNAADIQVKGMSPEDVQEYFLSEYPSSLGIGCYDTFTHIDVRDGKGRW